MLGDMGRTPCSAGQDACLAGDTGRPGHTWDTGPEPCLVGDTWQPAWRMRPLAAGVRGQEPRAGETWRPGAGGVEGRLGGMLGMEAELLRTVRAGLFCRTMGTRAGDGGTVVVVSLTSQPAPLLGERARVARGWCNIPSDSAKLSSVGATGTGVGVGVTTSMTPSRPPCPKGDGCSGEA